MLVPASNDPNRNKPGHIEAVKAQAERSASRHADFLKRKEQEARSKK